jgi:hypothetical protein
VKDSEPKQGKTAPKKCFLPYFQGNLSPGGEGLVKDSVKDLFFINT